MSSITESWINDYLDLYNYARSIGDSEWKSNILETLRNKDVLLQEYKKSILLRDLWRNYDTINRQLMEVFGKLREVADRSQAAPLQEQWFKLKIMRIDIARKISQYK